MSISIDRWQSRSVAGRHAAVGGLQSRERSTRRRVHGVLRAHWVRQPGHAALVQHWLLRTPGRAASELP
jgi:hypothetical protein